MKKIVLLSFVFITAAFAQQHRRPAVTPFHSRVPFYAEVHVTPSDTAIEINYLYRIPYNQMVFVKENSHYEAGISLSVEVYDTSGVFVARQIKDDHIAVDDFLKTNSPELCAQGLLKFRLPNKSYNLVPVITDNQSGQDAKLNIYRVKAINRKFLDFLLPVVVNDRDTEYKGKQVSVVTNYEGFVPFDQHNYRLIIPAVDTSLQKISVTITNETDTVFNGTVSNSYLSSNDMVEEGENVLLMNESDGQMFRNFVVNNFSNKLNVGKLKITVSRDTTPRYSDNFLKQVVWFNKPFSLRNPEFAIKALKYMTSDSVVSKVLDTSKENYGRSLDNFWDKYDPTPDTKFNELMNEYYLRVDFALMHFGTIAGKSGADTDRGKIFIKFGKPTYIERSSDDYGRMVERWVYKKERLTFIFIDKAGTGDFPLVKG